MRKQVIAEIKPSNFLNTDFDKLIHIILDLVSRYPGGGLRLYTLYSDSDVTYEILRLETDEEVSRREEDSRRIREEIVKVTEERERELYERLKRKFEK